MIVSIEGNIGSGKSTVLEILREYFKDNKKVFFVDEPVAEWNNVRDGDKTILELFYENKEKYSFSFQILAYITRLRKLLNAIDDKSNEIIICERSIYTDKFVFAKMLYQQGYINEIEWQSYNYWFDTFKEKTNVDSIIYINTEPNICFDRIKKRNRNGESSIPLEYLTHCHQLHHEWLHENKKDNIINFDGNIELGEDNQHEYINQLNMFMESQC